MLWATCVSCSPWTTSTIRSPGSADTARSSSTKWSSTKTCIGSATSEAPRAFSSGWPSESADADTGSGVIPQHWRTRWGPSLERKSVAAAPLLRTVVSASDGDDDLATRVAVSEVPDRGRHLFELERPVHNGSDGARFEQPPQLLQVLSALL